MFCSNLSQRNGVTTWSCTHNLHIYLQDDRLVLSFLVREERSWLPVFPPPAPWHQSGTTAWCAWPSSAWHESILHVCICTHVLYLEKGSTLAPLGTAQAGMAGATECVLQLIVYTQLHVRENTTYLTQSAGHSLCSKSCKKRRPLPIHVFTSTPPQQSNANTSRMRSTLLCHNRENAPNADYRNKS